MGIVKFIWVYTTYGKLYGKMNGIIIIYVFGMEIIWDQYGVLDRIIMRKP